MTDVSSDQDADLRRRLTEGDESALAAAFSFHRERLWQMVHFRLDRRLSGRVDEDDVLQDAYLDAAKRIGHFEDRGPGALFLWLRMVLTQTLADIHRRHLGAQARNVRREVAIREAFDSQSTSVSIAGQLLGGLTSPSQAAMRSELADQLDRALADMDPLDQEVLALRHFEELSNVEVAEVLGIQQKAASMRYVRALQRLRGVLERLAALE